MLHLISKKIWYFVFNNKNFFAFITDWLNILKSPLGSDLTKFDIISKIEI